MGDCPSAEMRDALPELMFQDMDAARRAEVESHVAGCADCTAELALVKRVRAIAATPAVNVDHVVQALPAPRRRSAMSHIPVLRMAAALALMIGGATWYANQRGDDVRVTPVMQVAQLTPATPTLGGGLSDLSDAELQTLLASMDSFEANVKTEPTVLLPVIESEDVR